MPKRLYDSTKRADAAANARARVIEAARALFSKGGFEAVTIAQIAEEAGVSASGIYANFKSKQGILYALMEQALFGSRYRAAVTRLVEEADPARQLIFSATIARAVHEGESEELGLIRGVSALSPGLKALEQDFEQLRLELQKPRVENLFSAGAAKAGLSLEEARRLLWMYTSREIYRLLVHEGGWTPDRYEDWLSQTLAAALIEPDET